MTQVSPYSEYVFVALGSNLPSGAGDPGDTIDFALHELAALSREPLLLSSIYATSPVDSPPGTPDFLNAVAALLPMDKERPLSLLKKLQGVEDAAGRKRSGIRNEARTLDLDLIFFKQEMMEHKDLSLPHPRAHERKFVLEPLRDIVGEEFVFPGLGKTIAQLLQDIGEGQLIARI